MKWEEQLFNIGKAILINLKLSTEVFLLVITYKWA